MVETNLLKQAHKACNGTWAKQSCCSKNLNKTFAFGSSPRAQASKPSSLTSSASCDLTSLPSRKQRKSHKPFNACTLAAFHGASTKMLGRPALALIAVAARDFVTAQDGNAFI